MSEFLEVAKTAALEAGRRLQSLRGQVSVREKGPRDLVTEADLEAQRTIRELVLGAYPEHGFLGEEGEGAPDAQKGEAEGRKQAAAAGDSPYRWVVDPLDGTTNYAHQLPMYAVSIALCREAEVIAGVVYDPSLEELFSAAEDTAASCNDVPLSVSGCRELRSALVAASFSANVPRGSMEITRFVEVLHCCRAVRRMGSAALNLGYLAAGRLDAYWASSVKTWDVAAGVLLVRRAGGIVTALDGGPFDLDRPAFIAAATPELHAQLLETLERAGV